MHVMLSASTKQQKKAYEQKVQSGIACSRRIAGVALLPTPQVRHSSAVLCHTRVCVCVQVRGVLNDEEVQLAATSRYLRGVHALVATPDMALALLSLPNSPLSFQVWRSTAMLLSL